MKNEQNKFHIWSRFESLKNLLIVIVTNALSKEDGAHLHNVLAMTFT